ncbi:MAG: SDR family oxidoreductase [Rhizobiales bacterium]|nr:SDR family oxidoreductase [Hyphomicrobiales bacterium]
MSLTPEMNGKTALVTGAASGLGRAAALSLGRAGADLCLVDVNGDGLAETAAMLPDSNILLHTANLADPDSCAPAVAASVDKFGQLDALCNIAGIVRMSHTDQMPRSDWDLTIAINLTAPFLLSQAAIPHLLESTSEGGGAIVNVASSAAFIGEAYAAAYCATKAGLVNMTKAMAMEYTRKPIRINAVAPGGMMTNIGNTMSFPEEAEMDLVARYSGLRGMVEVADAADMIAILASPAGRAFHGACINIDAGITAG